MNKPNVAIRAPIIKLLLSKSSKPLQAKIKPIIARIIPLFFFIVLTNYIGIYIDLRRPKLDWENETVAVKQNTNTLIYMLIDMAITMLIVALGVLLIFIRIPAFVASLILTLIFLALCVIIYRLMKRKGLELFNNIG